jgi:Flp pilus assembly protein TadD
VLLVTVDIPYYRKVIAAGPQTADAHVGLATALAGLERLDEAGRVLHQGLELDPSNGQLHYNLGEIARVRGAREEARLRYQAALADQVTRDRARARLDELP